MCTRCDREMTDRQILTSSQRALAAPAAAARTHAPSGIQWTLHRSLLAAGELSSGGWGKPAVMRVLRAREASRESLLRLGYEQRGERPLAWRGRSVPGALPTARRAESTATRLRSGAPAEQSTQITAELPRERHDQRHAGASARRVMALLPCSRRPISAAGSRGRRLQGAPWTARSSKRWLAPCARAARAPCAGAPPRSMRQRRRTSPALRGAVQLRRWRRLLGGAGVVLVCARHAGSCGTAA